MRVNRFATLLIVGLFFLLSFFACELYRVREHTRNLAELTLSDALRDELRDRLVSAGHVRQFCLPSQSSFPQLQKNTIVVQGQNDTVVYAYRDWQEKKDILYDQIFQSELLRYARIKQNDVNAYFKAALEHRGLDTRTMICIRYKQDLDAASSKDTLRDSMLLCKTSPKILGTDGEIVVQASVLCTIPLLLGLIPSGVYIIFVAAILAWLTLCLMYALRMKKQQVSLSASQQAPVPFPTRKLIGPLDENTYQVGLLVFKKKEMILCGRTRRLNMINKKSGALLLALLEAPGNHLSKEEILTILQIDTTPNAHTIFSRLRSALKEDPDLCLKGNMDNGYTLYIQQED